MTKKSYMTKKTEMTEKQRVFFERGFEEGYTVARRNYEAWTAHISTKNGLPITRKLHSLCGICGLPNASPVVKELYETHN